MRDLLTDLTIALDERRDCVFCSVVETRGSTPQKAGAAMLVFPDGSQRGTLGGGCVEAEVKQRALRVLALGQAQPEILSFCLDDDYGWDDGLICGGRMTILADPLPQNEKNAPSPAASYYQRFRQLIEEGRGCTEAVVSADSPAGLPVGSRMLFDGDGILAAVRVLPNGKNDGPALESSLATIRRFLVPLPQRPRPAVHQGIAYLPVLPRVTLLIVGGGHVGQAVARLASEVDFDVWVLDDRERYASRERFPTAQRILIGDIGAQLKELAMRAITPSCYCLIVTRGHGHDEEALYHLAGTFAGYVGMIGSKRKIKLIYEDLIARGIPAAALEQVHAPLGFAIGAQTVPEIAVSIVAELIACRNLGTALPEPRIRVRPDTTRRTPSAAES